MTAATKQWLLPALIAAGLSLVAGYFHNDKDLTSRVTAVETQQKNDHEAIVHTSEQVDKLVEWALGHK